MNKKILFQTLTLLALTSVLAACGGKASTPAAPKAPAAAATKAPAAAPAATKAPAAAPAATKAPAAAGSGAVAPMEGATTMTADEKTAIDAIAKGIAEKAGITGNYEGWKLPASTTWDAVLSYYDAQATTDGWTPDAGSVADVSGVAGGKMAAFAKADGTAFVLAYLPVSGNVYVIAITGTTAAAPAAGATEPAADGGATEAPAATTAP